MFSLQPDPTFRKRVRLPIPGKRKAGQTIEFEFRHKDQDALQAWLESIRDGRTEADALDEIIVRWWGPDEEYSREVLAKACKQLPALAATILQAYTRELTEAEAGN